jgi:hypothetical protein
VAQLEPLPDALRVPVPGEERTVILNDPEHRPRYWIVEVARSWFMRFWKLLVRFDEMSASLAAAVICWRKVGIICGYCFRALVLPRLSRRRLS